MLRGRREERKRTEGNSITRSRGQAKEQILRGGASARAKSFARVVPAFLQADSARSNCFLPLYAQKPLGRKGRAKLAQSHDKGNRIARRPRVERRWSDELQPRASLDLLCES